MLESVMGRRLAPRARLVTSHAITHSGTGQPPLHVRDAAKAALDRGQTHYTVGPGIFPLREALAARSTSEGFPASAESVVVTNGGSEALYIALQSVLRAGDRIVIAGPVAPNVIEMIAFIGATPLQMAGDAGSRFLAAPEQIVATDVTALLLASPSPITGMAIPAPDLQRLLEAATEREMTVILDRTLAWCWYEPDAATFPRPDLGARVLTTGSFSDAWAMHGWRVGYFSAPQSHLATMRELKQAMSICTSTMSQYAALAALEGPEDWLGRRRDTFAAERDRISGICERSNVEVLPADAWPPLLLRPHDAVTREELERRLGMPLEPAEPFGDALRGYLRARLSGHEGDVS